MKYESSEFERSLRNNLSGQAPSVAKLLKQISPVTAGLASPDSDSAKKSSQEAIILASELGKSLCSMAQAATWNLSDKTKRVRRRKRSHLRRFGRRLSKRWSPCLDSAEAFGQLCFETGAELNAACRQAAAESDVLGDTLCRLHARGCVVYEEMLCLLRNGFADGAMCRWRTLHEISCISAFLAIHGQNAAELYLEHQVVDALKSLRQQEEHKDRLNLEPIDEQEMVRLETMQSELVEKYGNRIKSEYGWAAVVLGKNGANFVEIENDVKLDHWRPYYRLASHGTHSGVRSLLFSMATTDDPPSILLAGPTDRGLADPAQCSVISLAQLTLRFINHYEPNVELLFLMACIKEASEFAVEEIIANHDTIALWDRMNPTPVEYR